MSVSLTGDGEGPRVLVELHEQLSREKHTPRMLDEVALQLRTVAELDVTAFLIGFSEVDAWAALYVALRVLRSRRGFDVLLLHGLRTADASTVRLWLEACVPRVGYRGMLRALAQVSRESPRRAQDARYWIQGLWRHEPLVQRGLVRIDFGPDER